LQRSDRDLRSDSRSGGMPTKQGLTGWVR